MRSDKEILEAENKYFEFLWYTRYMLTKERWLKEYQNSEKQELKDIAKKALENAERIEKTYAEDPEFIAVKEKLNDKYYEDFEKTLHYTNHQPLTFSLEGEESSTTLTMEVNELFEDHNSIYDQGWRDGYCRGNVDGKLSALRWVLGSEWDFLDT